MGTRHQTMAGRGNRSSGHNFSGFEGWSNNEETEGWSNSQQKLPPKKRDDWKKDECVVLDPGKGERKIVPGVIRHTSCPHTNLAFYYHDGGDSFVDNTTD